MSGREGRVSATDLAKEVLEFHKPFKRDLKVAADRSIVDVGELPEEQWWCEGPDHDSVHGGHWPCSVAALASAVLAERYCGCGHAPHPGMVCGHPLPMAEQRSGGHGEWKIVENVRCGCEG